MLNFKLMEFLVVLELYYVRLMMLSFGIKIMEMDISNLIWLQN